MVRDDLCGAGGWRTGRRYGFILLLPRRPEFWLGQRPAAVAELTGLVPGQRFLLPFSMIACIPPARFLNSRISGWDAARLSTIRVGALAIFIVGLAMLSIFHQAYLDAFAKIQDALHEKHSAGRAGRSGQIANELCTAADRLPPHDSGR